ncbi:hypothetical protein BDP55DRAFT_647566 [Colletotrichum godetiae]|uniref:Secreted protein n=1 Tax=Colletotrichum godetiae TaxID=1209918 RepID=A0AAJ0AZC7_9PEZI|nr:uncharacterized protein BDP55DRAFT_647566 [Colletotrichum godetiae]KAK1691625.1 hypothetical protein BDP55DRAFT_647566 [Colletotrichum godetiae]
MRLAMILKTFTSLVCSAMNPYQKLSQSPISYKQKKTAREQRIPIPAATSERFHPLARLLKRLKCFSRNFLRNTDLYNGT